MGLRAAGEAGLALGAMLLPSSLLAYGIARWLQRHHSWWPVQAFRLGMAPVVLGLLGATGWVLARGAAPGTAATPPWALWLITAVTAALVWRTRMHLLWLLAAGAALGVLGLV
ncbi:chromate transporter [Tepidimonas sp.]|uniref:chromate transporter n=1 Tax=Tepidimonas sp. TaxID=2002775 RepID=UPI003FCE3D54